MTDAITHRYAMAVISMIDASNVLRKATPPIHSTNAERLEWESANAIWDRQAIELANATKELFA